MNTSLSTQESTSDKKTRKKCRETVLAETIECMYKIMTFLLIKRTKMSPDSSESTQTNQIVFKVFSYLIHIILALNSARFVLVFIDEEARKQNMIIILLLFIFPCFFAACSIIHRLFCVDNLTQLRKRFLELEIQMDDKNIMNMYQQFKRWGIPQILSVIFMQITFIILIFTMPRKDSFLRIYFSYPITIESDAYWIVSVLTIILTFIANFWIFVSVYTALWLMTFLRKEFDSLAEAFREVFCRPNINTKENLSMTERSSRIFEMCEAHDNLCGVLESMNFLCCDNFAFILSLVIVMLCLLTYELIHRSMDNFEFVYFLSIVIINVAGNIYYLKQSIHLKSSAHQLTDDLYQIDLRNLSSEASLKVSIFLTRLTSSPIGISVAGLFVIDHSTILMLSGTLLTYIIVVIQTKDPGCGCQSNNNITTSGI